MTIQNNINIDRMNEYFDDIMDCLADNPDVKCEIELSHTKTLEYFISTMYRATGRLEFTSMVLCVTTVDDNAEGTEEFLYFKDSNGYLWARYFLRGRDFDQYLEDKVGKMPESFLLPKREREFLAIISDLKNKVPEYW